MYFIAAESANNCVKLFEKVAKFLESRNLIEEAISVLEEALTIIGENDVSYCFTDIFNYYIRLLIIADRFDDAIAAYKKEIEKNKINEKSYVFQVQ